MTERTVYLVIIVYPDLKERFGRERRFDHNHFYFKIINT